MSARDTGSTAGENGHTVARRFRAAAETLDNNPLIRVLRAPERSSERVSCRFHGGNIRADKEFATRIQEKSCFYGIYDTKVEEKFEIRNLPAEGGFETDTNVTMFEAFSIEAFGFVSEFEFRDSNFFRTAKEARPGVVRSGKVSPASFRSLRSLCFAAASFVLRFLLR
jgi:hypothetical protein